MTDISIRIHMFVSNLKSSIVSSLHSDERGQDLIEYALLGGLIAAAILAAAVLVAFTGGVTDMANGIGDCIDFDATTTCPV